MNMNMNMNMNINSSSMRQDEVDLSVEIGLAAATAAHVDDAASTTTSLSMRRKEADLSTEIRLTAAVMAAPTQPHEHDDDVKKKKDTIVEEEFTNTLSNTSNLIPEITNVDETKQPMNRRLTRVRGGQNTCSVLTSTTATTYGDSGYDHYEGDITSIPETPPIPERVQGSINRVDDGCSPLGLPTLTIHDS